MPKNRLFFRKKKKTVKTAEALLYPQPPFASGVWGSASDHELLLSNIIATSKS